MNRGLPSGFHRRPILVTPDSALKFLKYDWHDSCRQLFEAADRFVRKDDWVWDIGANVGVFSLAAADRAGSEGGVLAVEADPFLASLINRSARNPKNNDVSVKTLCGAISDKQAIAFLGIAQRGRSSNALTETGFRTQAGGVRSEVPVLTTRLDDLLLCSPMPPNFIKIDIEGAEIMALRGAGQILESVRPAFFVEVGGEQRGAVSSIFQKHDYILFDGGDFSYPRRPECCFNTLAIPREKLNLFMPGRELS